MILVFIILRQLVILRDSSATRNFTGKIHLPTLVDNCRRTFFSGLGAKFSRLTHFSSIEDLSRDLCFTHRRGHRRRSLVTPELPTVVHPQAHPPTSRYRTSDRGRCSQLASNLNFLISLPARTSRQLRWLTRACSVLRGENLFCSYTPSANAITCDLVRLGTLGEY